MTGNAGGRFQYTNRHDDLNPRSDWKPGDPWDEHYGQTGYEDRDRQLEDYLGGGITTRRLFLVDSTGAIVAEFGSSSLGAHSLVFKHNDPLTSDSVLYWSKVGELAAGAERVVLSGPASTGASGGGPQISLGVESGNVQLVEIDTADATGTLSAGFQVDGANKLTNTFANTEPKADVNGTSRGSGYGLSFHQVILGSNTNLTTTNANLVSVSLPSCPVACFAEVHWSCDMSQLIASAVGVVFPSINGTPQTPQSVYSDATVGNRSTVSGHYTYALPAGSNTIALTGVCSVNNGTLAVGASGTFLSVTLCR